MYNRQTCRCGECRCRYTPEGNRRCCPEKTVRHAVDCYREGMSVSAAVRVSATPEAIRAALGESG